MNAYDIVYLGNKCNLLLHDDLCRVILISILTEFAVLVSRGQNLFNLRVSTFRRVTSPIFKIANRCCRRLLRQMLQSTMLNYSRSHFPSR